MENRIERISSEEAHKGENGTYSLLKNIAAGLYWYASEDYRDGRQFDKPAVQQKKAALFLEKYEAEQAALPDPATLTREHCGEGSWVDIEAKRMLLRIHSDSGFMESITKAPSAPEVEPTKPESEPQQEPDVDEPELSPADKLQLARDSVRGLLPSLNF